MAKKAAPTPTEEVVETVETPKAEKPVKRGIGTAAREAIRLGMTNEDALAAVLAEFPEGNTSLASVNWYRNDLKKKEEGILSGREAAADKKAGTGYYEGQGPQTDAPEQVQDDEGTDSIAGDEDLEGDGDDEGEEYDEEV